MQEFYRLKPLLIVYIVVCSCLPSLSSTVSKASRDNIHLIELPISVQAPIPSISTVSFIPLSQRVSTALEDFDLNHPLYSEGEKEHDARNIYVHTENDDLENPFVANNTVLINGLSEVKSIPINNALFEGKLIVLLRANPTYEYEFGGDKNINWEVQLQGKFKRTPGPLYLSVEIPKEENFHLSWGLRAVINACCKLIQFFGYDLHKSLGEKGEIPHFASPAFQAFDKFIATNTSEMEAPKIGQEIEESYESCILRRKLEKEHVIDTSLTYTMSFNDTFFDPAKWSVTGVPLFKNIDVSKFASSLRLVLYEVEEEDNQPFREKTGNAAIMVKGKHTKRNVAMWMQMHRAC